MFVTTRTNPVGIIKIKELPTLKNQKQKKLHNNIIAFRNDFVAHNDVKENHILIAWSKKHKMHFPQRFKKIYWDQLKSQDAINLMKSVEKDILKISIIY